MLKLVRKGAKSLLGTLMLGAISLVFVFSFGPGANGCQSVNPNQNVADYVMIFNGKKISIGEYQEVRKTVYLEQQQNRANLSEMELNSIIMNRLIQEQLLLDFAKKLNLVVSDKEKDAYITNIPYFQVNNKFDYTTYKKIVQNYFNTTPLQYEKNTKKNILIVKAGNILASSISISDAKLWEIYQSYEKKMDLSYMSFEPKKETIAITDEELTAYLASNDADIKKYFDSNKDEFSHAKQVEARHILVKVDKKQKDAVAKQKIEKIEKELKAGGDFVALAKKYSEGPSKTKGGMLGYFTKERMVKPFSEAAFKLKVNEVSAPVKTSFGYHLIKVTGIKEASSDKYEDVKSKIAKKLLVKGKKDTAMTALKASLKENLVKAKTITELNKLMPEFKINTQKDVTTFSTYIPGLGVAKDLVDDIFKAGVKVKTILPKTYNVSGKLVVAQVDKINLDKEKFEKEKDQIKASAIQRDKNQFLDAWISKKKAESTITIHPNYLTQN